MSIWKILPGILADIQFHWESAQVSMLNTVFGLCMQGKVLHIKYIYSAPNMLFEGNF